MLGKYREVDDRELTVLIDGRTQKISTMHNTYHTKVLVEKLYLSRTKGGSWDKIQNNKGNTAEK